MGAGGGGGGLKGLVHNLLMQCFTLGSSKIEVTKTDFFNNVSTNNDHRSNVKHVLGCSYVFFTLSGYWVLGGGGLTTKTTTTLTAAAAATVQSAQPT